MVLNRGNKHTFVGMDIEITDNDKIKVLMDQYIKECLEVYVMPNIKTKKTPGAHDLFEIDSKSDRLNKEQSELFHHIVAKLLYVAKRARLDIEPSTSFLCTRVSKSTKQDWKKLGRVLGYLKGTMHMPRILGVENFNVIRS